MADVKENKKKTKSLSAIKCDRQNEKRCERNKIFKSRVKTALASLKEELQKAEKEGSQKALDSVYSLMDKAVKRGIFKQNKADRMKSRSKAKVKALTS